jgi:hypothetical protein
MQLHPLFTKPLFLIFHMPPRVDPYSNKTHRRIDAVLVAITLVLMVFAFRVAAKHRQSSVEPIPAAQAPSNSAK